MTLYIELPADTGKLEQLVSQFGAQILPGQPRGLDEIPPGKALLCVGDMGAYETAGYIITQGEFASWTDPAACGPKTWLPIDRRTADELCPGAPEHRQIWQSATARDTEAASHPGNLIPVARTSRSGLRLKAEMLRKHAAALRGEAHGTRHTAHGMTFSPTPGASRSPRPIWTPSRMTWSRGSSVTGSLSSTLARNAST
jgi:hypothetical protein